MAAQTFNEIVEGNPEVVRDLFLTYFKQDWQFGGETYGPNRMGTIEVRIYSRSMIQSPLGILTFLVLTILTVGMFAVAWFVYAALIRADLQPWVTVMAVASGPSQTRVTVEAKNLEHGQAVAEWARRTLLEGRAAAPQEREQPASSDIPEQINKLAGLRDSGTLTEEEFERKKAELLDRM